MRQAQPPEQLSVELLARARLPRAWLLEFQRPGQGPLPEWRAQRLPLLRMPVLPLAFCGAGSTLQLRARRGRRANAWNPRQRVPVP